MSFECSKKQNVLLKSLRGMRSNQKKKGFLPGELYDNGNKLGVDSNDVCFQNKLLQIPVYPFIWKHDND